MGTNIEGNSVKTMRKLKLDEALASSAVVTNPESTKNGQDIPVEQSSLYEE